MSSTKSTLLLKNIDCASCANKIDLQNHEDELIRTLQKSVIKYDYYKEHPKMFMEISGHWCGYFLSFIYFYRECI